MTDLYIRDKYSGRIHRIGDEKHDMLVVDESGTVHYRNLQCGDGCIGYKSVNQETLKDKYPDRDWKSREKEYCYGYEFVPNEDYAGFPVNPIEEKPFCEMTEEEKKKWFEEEQESR